MVVFAFEQLSMEVHDVLHPDVYKRQVLERVAVGVGGLDSGGELFVGEGLGVSLLPLVGGVRVLAQGRDIGLGKPDLLKRCV